MTDSFPSKPLASIKVAFVVALVSALLGVLLAIAHRMFASSLGQSSIVVVLLMLGACVTLELLLVGFAPSSSRTMRFLTFGLLIGAYFLATASFGPGGWAMP